MQSLVRARSPIPTKRWDRSSPILGRTRIISRPAWLWWNGSDTTGGPSPWPNAPGPLGYAVPAIHRETGFVCRPLKRSQFDLKPMRIMDFRREKKWLRSGRFQIQIHLKHLGRLPRSSLIPLLAARSR